MMPFTTLFFLVAPVCCLEEFRFFRCDSCRASLYQVNAALKSLEPKRKKPLLEHEYVELMDNVCRSSMTKDVYGVRSFNGRSYLFGPGVKDHISGQGFGQMGMGDYDHRLRSYCIMFVEHFDETTLYKEFQSHGEVLVDKHCAVECQSDASGMGPASHPDENAIPLSHNVTSTEETDGKLSHMLHQIRLLSVDDKRKVKAELELMLEDTHVYDEL